MDHSISNSHFTVFGEAMTFASPSYSTAHFVGPWVDAEPFPQGVKRLFNEYLTFDPRS